MIPDSAVDAEGEVVVGLVLRVVEHVGLCWVLATEVNVPEGLGDFVHLRRMRCRVEVERSGNIEVRICLHLSKNCGVDQVFASHEHALDL